VGILEFVGICGKLRFSGDFRVFKCFRGIVYFAYFSEFEVFGVGIIPFLGDFCAV